MREVSRALRGGAFVLGAVGVLLLTTRGFVETQLHAKEARPVARHWCSAETGGHFRECMDLSSRECLGFVSERFHGCRQAIRGSTRDERVAARLDACLGASFVAEMEGRLQPLDHCEGLARELRSLAGSGS